MIVDNFEVEIPQVGLVMTFPVPLQIALSIRSAGGNIDIALTSAWHGVCRPAPGGGVILQLDHPVGGVLCDVRLTWAPQTVLTPAIPFGFFNSLESLFVSSDVGNSSLTADVLETSRFHGPQVTETYLERFVIEKLPLTFSGDVQQSHTMKVGDTVKPDRKVLGGSPVHEYFDPTKQLAAAVGIQNLSDEEAVISEITQPYAAVEDAPFSVQYSWDGAIDSPSAARFDRPRADALADAGIGIFNEGLLIVHARRPGEMVLEPSLEDLTGQYETNTWIQWRDRYTVSKCDLTSTLVAAPGNEHNGNLLFEDDWLEDPTHPQGGRLVSTFHLEVKRDAEVIYRSSEEAAFDVELSPGRLYLRRIARVNADGTETLLSFDLSFSSSKPELVDFWLTADEIGKPRIRRTLDRILMVKDYGVDCEITSKLRDLAEPVPIEQDVYTMDKLKRLPVEIAPPLEADLTTWIDGYFRAANALDLHLHPNEEVIYDTGQIQGLVRGHNPDSESEVISLKVIPEGVSADDAAEMTIVFGSGAAHREEFTATVVGLELGGNLIRMTATKPINLVTTGPSEDEVTLEGVPPRDVSLQGLDADQNGVNDSGIVLKRDAGRFEWTYSKATSARLVYRAPDGARDWDTYGLGYELEGDTVNVTLDRDTGMHTLQFIATNVFADVESQPFEMQAPEPELTPDFQTWNLPHHPTDSLYVGNSVSEVDLRITVLHCLYYEVFDGTSTVQEDPASPFASTTATRTVSLDEGDNFFTFTYNNEFASPFTPPIKVRRRRFVFDVEGSLEVRPLDTNQEAIVELVDIQPPEFGNLLPGSLQIVFDITFAVPESASPIGFDSMKWRIKDRDDDHSSDDRPSTLDYRIAFSAASFDPDFVKSISFMEILASDVDEDDPNSDPFPMWSLADTSGLVLDGANRYWSRAHVFASAGELWIPIHTRAAS